MTGDTETDEVDQTVEERFYDRLDGSMVSGHPRSKPLAITCPNCGYATEVDFEVWDCEHCGETLALFVGSFASMQTSETEESCADATRDERDDRTLKERINDEMVVSRGDSR